MRLVGALVAITALSFFVFPGHTYLQQDTQIYVPILEHQWSGALANDLIVEHPHVNFTLYDELTKLVRWITRAPLQYVLEGEQFLFRGLGFYGIFLIGAALGLAESEALVVTAIFALGASIAAPAVLTVEYEPTPRAFAVPLIFLSLGFLLHRRDWLAGFAAAGAVLLHAPTVWPLCVALLCAGIIRRGSLFALVPLLLGTLALLVIGKLQSVAEPQDLLSHISAQQESLQRMRAAYNYVSTWWSFWWLQYVAFLGVAIFALFRVRISREIRVVLGLLVVTGALSVPLSWLLLEHWRFSATPQIQPARALLFVTAIAVIASANVACRLRSWKSFAWFAFPLLVSTHTRFFEWPTLAAAVVVLVCAAILTRPRFRPYSAALLAPALLLGAGILTHQDLETADLKTLSAWAREATPANAVFAFPQDDRGRAPGWFRSVALRPVYVDWKGGGQVNYLRAFSDEWWKRWQLRDNPPPAEIDFVVVHHPRPNARPVFQNATYFVYPVKPAV